MIRDGAAIIISVGPEIEDVLGWQPDQLIGRPSTEFIHPEDQGSAIAAWFEMIDTPGQPRRWQGRYRTSDGGWRWVECENANRLDDPDHPVVFTTMRRVTVDQVSLADELRARKELLSRLSDVVPIGMFEIDTAGCIKYTNDRFHSILGRDALATIEAEFSDVASDDRDALMAAIDMVLSGEDVDDVELRFSRSPDPRADEQVCVLSMRPLTDATGTIAGAVGCLSDVTEQVQLRHQLEIRANTDQLTSCLNRAAIFDILSMTVSERTEESVGLGVIYVDLCRFKGVNDAFGHGTGDRVLVFAGDRIRSAVRDGDHVGRVGGDEFLIVCPGVGSDRDVLDIADRIRASLTDRIDFGKGEIELRASIGLAWTRQSVDADELVARADHAMYQAKRCGSDSVGIFAPGRAS